MSEMGDSCFPSYDKLQKATGRGRTTLANALKEAIKEGWLAVEKHGYKGQKWARNDYRATFPNEPKKAVSPQDQLDEKGSLENAEGSLPSGLKAVSPQDSNTPVISPLQNTTGDARTDFEKESASSVYYEFTRVREGTLNGYWVDLMNNHVGDNPARLEIWKGVCLSWDATHEPGSGLRPYNLGNIRKMLGNFDECDPPPKAEATQVLAESAAKLPHGVLSVHDAIDDASRKGVDVETIYEPLPKSQYPTGWASENLWRAK